MQHFAPIRRTSVRRSSRLSGPVIRRELRITAVALAVTIVAAGLAIADIVGVLAQRLGAHRWTESAGQGLFLLIVLSLVYGAGVYHLARLGHFRRMLAHEPASDDALWAIFDTPVPPLVTALVPSYMEEVRVVRRTLLSIALQEYPRRRAVLLIDNPPSPASDADATLLEATRALPGEIESLLEEPKKHCAAALDAFRARLATAPLDPADEHARLAALHADIADWFLEQAQRYDVVDHGDRLFVELTFRGPARDCRAEAERLDAMARDTTGARELDAWAIVRSYARLLTRFDTEVASFERKRYENLSHAANKAMNLNSYIGLIGQNFCEQPRDGRLFLEPCHRAAADLVVPKSEFVLIVDADSMLTPDYALRLVHLMRLPANARVAVAQTPYQAFPGAPSPVEQVAGATTDIQYLIHQGFTHYDATYWVGANAVVRTAALADIATHAIERGYEVTRFIRDDTVIEDTESTVDLMARGWRLHNYPEPLAYSETPPDFGSLLIQRRRWANGGLLILPALLQHLGRQLPHRPRVLQGLMMVHYLTSLAMVNAGLLIVLGFSFESSTRSVWLPLTAVPYYLLYARDLRLIGRRALDVCRVYALNLVLLPVNLAGVLGSLRQALGGRKAAFRRTPKIRGRTKVPALYVVAEYGLLAQWLCGVLRDVLEHRPVHALLTVTNILFLAYGLIAFIGLRDSIDDITGALSPVGAVMSRANVADLTGARAWGPDRPGRVGLAVAVMAGAGLAVVVAARGVSWVNLDTLLANPPAFYALFVAPALLTLTGLVIALPRIVAVNVAVFVALIVCGEIGARALTSTVPAISGEPEVAGAASFYVPDPELGYTLPPSTIAHHRRMEGTQVAYDVTYETDDRARRRTPIAGEGRREAFLAFFGDSNTFGEGLGQTETLPFQAGALAAGYRPYNYGVPGYGPAQLLTLAAKRRLGDEIAEPEGDAVYLLIPAHVARVVGAAAVSTRWGRHFPYYTLGPGGGLQSDGDFVHARPFTTLGYYFWTRSSLAAHLGVELPVRYTAHDYRLTAKILAESSRMLARQIHLRRFVVVLGQVFNDPQRRVVDAMRDALAAEGVETLDYTRLFDANDRRYRVSDADYHNSAEANHELAARLVSDLGIAR